MIISLLRLQHPVSNCAIHSSPPLPATFCLPARNESELAKVAESAGKFNIILNYSSFHYGGGTQINGTGLINGL